MDYSSGRRKNRDPNFAGIKNFFLSDPNFDELAKYALKNPYKHDENSKQNLDKNGNSDSPGIELPIHKKTENSEAPEENGGKMDTTVVIVDDSTSADKSKGGKSKSPKSANTSGSPDRSKVISSKRLLFSWTTVLYFVQKFERQLSAVCLKELARAKLFPWVKEDYKQNNYGPISPAFIGQKFREL